MLTQSQEPQEPFVFRRVHPQQFNSKSGLPKPQVFALRENEEGVSILHDSVVNARGALQAFIDDNTARLQDEDETARERARKNLERFPTVEAMVELGWKIVKIPVSEIEKRGFELSEIEQNGHLEIRGEPERFKECELDFVELVQNGTARVLSDAECLVPS